MWYKFIGFMKSGKRVCGHILRFESRTKMNQIGKIRKIFKDKSWMTISNGLTLARIFLSPVVAYAITLGRWRMSLVLFAVAAMTDVLDGYLARVMGTQTNLGQLMDPFADKIFLLTAFWALALSHTPMLHIPMWFAMFILIREFVLILGSCFMMLVNPDFRVQPIIWGKLTTCFQSIFIMWLFICYFFGWAPAKTFWVALVVLSLFSFLALIQYLRIGFWAIKESK